MVAQMVANSLFGTMAGVAGFEPTTCGFGVLPRHETRPVRTLYTLVATYAISTHKILMSTGQLIAGLVAYLRA